MINTRIANLYCRDDLSLIENYDKAIADTTQTWVCHHRLELTLDGDFAHSREELKRMNMYYHCPANELIFLTTSEHLRLHGKHRSEEHRRKIGDAKKGQHHTDETRRKMSESHRGMNNPRYGKPSSMKGKNHSAETKRKMSEAMKGQHKGKHWKLIDGKRVWY